VGEAESLRAYFLCDRCHHGQFPIDRELDIENTELSPGVRRMLATFRRKMRHSEPLFSHFQL